MNRQVTFLDNMSALRAETERGLALLRAWVLSGFLFFRYVTAEGKSRNETRDLAMRGIDNFAPQGAINDTA
uniref:Uncharacterized protein n=1 Tax=Candidatus Kentrum sp. TUN TaxID=2126343 RepID=A0A450ZHA2_9GAMM|nr:MAG: hypothetical protein BECKTUN1418F_GA0071002_10118 [Candidatus Kentron sp. TUN]VFK53164.1 MAG: hypothetical protein BECKTUN1418E_GA0071001_10138 [Candidatus Kentron sp. TUN]VFK55721.1 MAG: hypothetical protein BECKTUN1418D_GA0071000_10368 [Candidatus Kentron sp. TUN]